MSLSPPPMHSPNRMRATYETTLEVHRWTVDNSESRFYEINSPVRSILKGANTPLKYNSPMFQHEQEQRRKHLAQRRVSFAPDANLRVFTEDDSADLYMRNVPNITEEAEPTVLMSDLFASPASQTTMKSPFLQRLTGSPSDRRKRRPDLFGSPPGDTRSPKRRSGGQPPSLLNRVFDEKEDDEGTSDLTQYIAVNQQKGRRNIFEEDDEDGEEEDDETQDMTIEPEDPTVESMIMTQTIPPAVQAVQQHSPPQQSEDYNEHIEEAQEKVVDDEENDQQEQHDTHVHEDYTMEEDGLHGVDDDAMQITQELPFHNALQSPATASIHSPLRKSPPRDYAGIYSPHRSFYLHDKSPLQNQSAESTHIFEFQGVDDDLLDEEFPETYHSIPDSTIANIPLSDFLSIAGISFPPEIPAKELRRRSTYNADYGTATVAEQAVAAASTLPQLELYQSSCQKLNQLIRDCKNTIDDIDKTVSAANPQFFSEYNESSVAIRSQMGSRFFAIKNYARSKAAANFYKTWCGLLQDFMKLLEENHNKLLQDDKASAEFEQRLLDKMPEIFTYQEDLKRALQEARAKEAEYNLIDHKTLSILEQEISQQEKSIQGFTNQAEKLDKDELDLLKKARSLEQRKSELIETIHKAETVLKSNQCVSEWDLVHAADAYNKYSDINKFKLKQAMDDDTIELSINGDVNIVIDQRKLRNKSQDAVLIRMLESRDVELGPLSELVHGLQSIARNKWDMNEVTIAEHEIQMAHLLTENKIIQDISIYWNRVRMIQNELENIQRRFWVEIKSLEFASEPEDAGFSCQICVYSFLSKTKFTVSFQIKPKDVLDYPRIDLSTLEVNLHYGNIIHSTLEDMLRKSISESGFTNLVDTLRHILDQISIPS